MSRENRYQAKLIRRLEDLFPGIFILKNDSEYLQGVPDLLLLYNRHWAMLECKRSADAPVRPNQKYYIELLNDLSYANFIFPENEKEVIRELQFTFGINK